MFCMCMPSLAPPPLLPTPPKKKKTGLPRKYWRHWASVATWASQHPAREGGACPLPLAFYGDEAKFNEQNDKFIALVLQSPLVRKGGGFVFHPTIVEMNEYPMAVLFDCCLRGVAWEKIGCSLW